ncbi:MAG: lytic transglycosylase domain-containing protein, partial [Alphaproteobacteria bacterium]|nr:lytic transglycosylase domain-containing protein [Alphaproteobacteria bacterium]
PSAWWDNLALAARESMEIHRYRLAYRLAAEAGLKTGDAFAQSQFLAGWLALRFLHDPAAALRHFQLLAAGVSRPISLARAYYWMGRTYEAKEEMLKAVRAYQLAAQHSDTYYGQLALARLDPNAELTLPHSKSEPEKIAASYDSDQMTRVIHILAQLHAGRFVRIFAEHDVERHPNPSFVARLASDLVQLGYRDAAVQAAKYASYRGIELPTFSHPIISLPRYRGPGSAPEDALVLALIRQETEFDATAVSSAGARGLMQVMPSSARQLASKLGVPFRPEELVANQDYNMELGMTELAQNLRKWDGSYILAAAGYNAGDRNVRHWIDLFGDPRTSAIDPIDWIEMIPFAETRNYVQRILESTQIYRDRLSGKSEPLEILADLYRPYAPPPQRPLPPLVALPKVPVPTLRPIQASNPSPAQTASIGGTSDPSSATITPRIRPKPNGSMQ